MSPNSIYKTLALIF